MYFGNSEVEGGRGPEPQVTLETTKVQWECALLLSLARLGSDINMIPLLFLSTEWAEVKSAKGSLDFRAVQPTDLPSGHLAYLRGGAHRKTEDPVWSPFPTRTLMLRLLCLNLLSSLIPTKLQVLEPSPVPNWSSLHLKCPYFLPPTIYANPTHPTLLNIISL